MFQDTKKIAVWGLGNHAIKRILPAIKEVKNLQLMGVCSRRENIVRDWAQKMNCHGWTDPEDMLKISDLDIIYISTPIGLHAEQGKKVLLAGKHLWCEKPFTCNLLESEKLVNLSRQKGLTVAEGFMYLYHPQFCAIEDIITSKKLGHIKEISFRFGFPHLKSPGFRYQASLGGGTLWDVGCYSISAAINLLKNQTVKVQYVELRNSEYYNVDVDGTVILEFSKGTKVISTWHTGVGYKNDIDIWGDKGSLYSDKIFSKLNNYSPNIWYKDQNGTLEIQELVSTNHFVKMFDNFLLLISSNELAEQERINIIKRAKVMDLIFNH